MSHWIVYEYSKCSTCKKALAFLDKKKIKYTKIQITEQPPTATELKAMLGYLGGHLKKLFNTSGIQYRELGMSEQLKSLSEAQAIQLLSKNGKLVKRPFLIGNHGGTVGFDETNWAQILNS